MERHEVLADRDGPSGVAKGFVADTPGLQLRDERTGSRHTDHFHTGLGESAELRAQEEDQAHVDRGDVDESLPDQCVQCDRATCR